MALLCENCGEVNDLGHYSVKTKTAWIGCSKCNTHIDCSFEEYMVVLDHYINNLKIESIEETIKDIMK